MSENNSKICQSCGMPLDKSDQYGTNSNGTMNNEYCHFCFKDGKFTDDGISMEEKIEKNIMIARKMGMLEGKAREMAKIIPTLKRWRK